MSMKACELQHITGRVGIVNRVRFTLNMMIRTNITLINFINYQLFD